MLISKRRSGSMGLIIMKSGPKKLLPLPNLGTQQIWNSTTRPDKFNLTKRIKVYWVLGRLHWGLYTACTELRLYTFKTNLNQPNTSLKKTDLKPAYVKPIWVKTITWATLSRSLLSWACFIHFQVLMDWSEVICKLYMRKYWYAHYLWITPGKHLFRI